MMNQEANSERLVCITCKNQPCYWQRKNKLQASKFHEQITLQKLKSDVKAFYAKNNYESILAFISGIQIYLKSIKSNIQSINLNLTALVHQVDDERQLANTEIVELINLYNYIKSNNCQNQYILQNDNLKQTEEHLLKLDQMLNEFTYWFEQGLPRQIKESKIFFADVEEADQLFRNLENEKAEHILASFDETVQAFEPARNYLRGLELMREQKFEEAIEMFQLAQTQGLYLQPAIQEGNALLQSEKYEEACDHLKILRDEVDPNLHLQIHYLLGKSLMKLQRNSEALELLKKAALFISENQILEKSKKMSQSTQDYIDEFFQVFIEAIELTTKDQDACQSWLDMYSRVADKKKYVWIEKKMELIRDQKKRVKIIATTRHFQA